MNRNRKPVALSEVDKRIPPGYRVEFVLSVPVGGHRPPEIIMQTNSLSAAQARSDELWRTRTSHVSSTVWVDEKTGRQVSKMKVLRSGVRVHLELQVDNPHCRSKADILFAVETALRTARLPTDREDVDAPLGFSLLVDAEANAREENSRATIALLNKMLAEGAGAGPAKLGAGAVREEVETWWSQYLQSRNAAVRENLNTLAAMLGVKNKITGGN